MIDYGTQRSSIRPQAVEILETKVFTATDITEILEEGSDGVPGFEGYEFNLVEYSKDEYIQKIQTENETLSEEITNTQIALCEVYELMG